MAAKQVVPREPIPRWATSARLQGGRKVFMLYEEEMETWHDAILLQPATPAARKKFMDETVADESLNWWILTPDGDV